MELTKTEIEAIKVQQEKGVPLKGILIQINVSRQQIFNACIDSMDDKGFSLGDVAPGHVDGITLGHLNMQVCEADIASLAS